MDIWDGEIYNILVDTLSLEQKRNMELLKVGLCYSSIGEAILIEEICSKCVNIVGRQSSH